MQTAINLKFFMACCALRIKALISFTTNQHETLTPNFLPFGLLARQGAKPPSFCSIDFRNSRSMLYLCHCFVQVLLPFGLVYVPMPPARYLARKSPGNAGWKPEEPLAILAEEILPSNFTLVRLLVSKAPIPMLVTPGPIVTLVRLVQP